MQDPATVEGRRREEVEQGQHHVDPRQPPEGGGGQPAVGAGYEKGADEEEQPTEQQADQRADAGDQELGAGASGVTVDPRHSAHPGEGDAVDPQVEPAGHHRVPQLVQQHAEQEDNGGQPAGDVVRRTRIAGCFDWKSGCSPGRRR